MNDLSEFCNLLILRNHLGLLSEEKIVEVYQDYDCYCVFLNTVLSLIEKDSGFLLLDDELIPKILLVIQIHRFDCNDADVSSLANELIYYLNVISSYSPALKNTLKMQYLFYHQDLRGVTFQSYEKLLSSLSYDAIAFSALMGDQMDIIRKDSNFMMSLSYFKEVCPEMFFDTNVGNRASQKLKEIYKNSKMFSSQKKYVKSLYHSIQKIPQKEE